MNRYPITVAPSGAILLGKDVSCDGFHRDYKVRVQTHIHDDHMDDFQTSKGLQQIWMSPGTRDLLVATFNADLPYRQNFHVLSPEATKTLGATTIRLLPSGHMLGSVQVEARLPDGISVGYSGDFDWPLDRIIEVEGLVVDSTYGSPERRRHYTQGEAEMRFLELVLSKLKKGPVHVKAHRGTLQRGLQVLSGKVQCPILGSERLCSETQVYRQHGYAIPALRATTSLEAKEALSSGRFIQFYGKGDKFPIEIGQATSVTLSAFMSRPDDPVLEHSEKSFSVALSNHADFDGTLEYIRATGAKYVLTDNSRGGHAVELANEIRVRLGIKAEFSQITYTYEWGR